VYLNGIEFNKKYSGSLNQSPSFLRMSISNYSFTLALNFGTRSLSTVIQMQSAGPWLILIALTLRFSWCPPVHTPSVLM
jgi:hypothetical protein